MGSMAEGDKDEFKRVLLEGNPLFLALTFVVSLLHSVFDMLAFKNDIGFWKNKKTIEGLSVKTIIINVFCQVRVPVPMLGCWCYNPSTLRWSGLERKSRGCSRRRSAVFTVHSNVLFIFGTIRGSA